VIDFFMFHDIRDKNEDFFPRRYDLPSFITLDMFGRSIDIIKSTNRRILGGGECFEDLYLKKDCFSVLTFDDGLVDHLRIARLLNQGNLQAIFFIPYAPVFKSSVINSHKIQFILASTDLENLVSELKNLYFQHYEWKFKSEIDQFFLSSWKNNLWSREMVFFTRVLREAGDFKWRSNTLNFLFSKYVTSDAKSFASEFYLSPEQVDEVYQLGHLIGGHGNQSLDLRFEGPETIQDEILTSRRFLKKYTSTNFLYAYANGGVNDLAVELLQANDFMLGLSTDNIDLSSDLDSTKMNFLTARIDGTKLV